MSWDIEYTDEFGSWWSELSESEQESLTASVRLLEERGPNLGFPRRKWGQVLKSKFFDLCHARRLSESSRVVPGAVRQTQITHHAHLLRLTA
jgi:hypothetical protein